MSLTCWLLYFEVWCVSVEQHPRVCRHPQEHSHKLTMLPALLSAGTAQLPPQQAYVTPLQLPPRQQQQLWPGSSGAGGSSMQRVLAAAGTVGGVLGVQVR